MTLRFGWSLPIAACLLTACGGGGGTSGGVDSTPPPPPPPAVTYNSFGNLTSDQVVILSGVTFTRSDNPFGSGATTVTHRPFSNSALRIGYNSATGGYTVQSHSGNQSFLPSDIDPSLTFNGPAFTNYAKGTSDYLSLYRPAGGGGDVPLTYTTLVSWTRAITVTGNTQTDTMWGVGGFETVASDMPRTGSATYTGPLRGQSVNGTNIAGVSGQARLTANFGTQSVQTDLFLNGVRPSTLVVGGTGTIQSTRFAGNLSGEGYTGVFDGAFFGPQAAEMGLSFLVSNPDGTTVGGVGAGRK